MADIELVIKIPDHLYKLLKDFPSDSNETTIENVLIKAVENGTPIPDNATNGDMLLTMFDTATVYGIDKENDCIAICLDNNFYQKFRYSWWNAPYQKGGKE